MKPTVGDDMDQGGNVANRIPNRYRKKLASLLPIESAGARAVYGGNFFGDEKSQLCTPDGPHGGDGKLSHMLHPPAPIKSCQEVELLPMHSTLPLPFHSSIQPTRAVLATKL